jgi:hypothetical protein
LASSLTAAQGDTDPLPREGSNWILFGDDSHTSQVDEQTAVYTPSAAPRSSGQEQLSSVSEGETTGGPSTQSHREPKQIDDYTCRYYGTSHYDGEFRGDGTGRYGVDTHQGAYAESRDVRSAFVPGRDSSFAEAEAGVTIDTGNLEHLQGVSVAFPWQVTGTMEVDTERASPLPGLSPAASDAEAHYELDVVLAVEDLEADKRLVDETLDRGIPGTPRTENVDESGSRTLSASAQHEDTLKGFLRSHASTWAESSLGTNAKAESDFFDDGPASTSYQDWTFDLAEGWIITSCT